MWSVHTDVCVDYSKLRIQQISRYMVFNVFNVWEAVSRLLEQARLMNPDTPFNVNSLCQFLNKSLSPGLSAAWNANMFLAIMNTVPECRDYYERKLYLNYGKALKELRKLLDQRYSLANDEIIDIVLFLLNVSPAIEGATATAMHLSRLHKMIPQSNTQPASRPSNMGSIMSV